MLASSTSGTSLLGRVHHHHVSVEIEADSTNSTVSGSGSSSSSCDTNEDDVGIDHDLRGQEVLSRANSTDPLSFYSADGSGSGTASSSSSRCSSSRASNSSSRFSSCASIQGQQLLLLLVQLVLGHLIL
ncbi:unnamed protein product [Amoebophrya sp. A25]|nr:unnamed protein product [Amoebophrya sp. A25]|eukprot:GSA25T00022037001.1